MVMPDRVGRHAGVPVDFDEASNLATEQEVLDDRL